jgi:hypothetical protein
MSGTLGGISSVIAAFLIQFVNKNILLIYLKMI